jgi:hypothetical protein
MAASNQFKQMFVNVAIHRDDHQDLQIMKDRTGCAIAFMVRNAIREYIDRWKVELHNQKAAQGFK